MILYHVSYHNHGPFHTFVPRLPVSEDDDQVTHRICVAPSIEQCILGMEGLKILKKCLPRRKGKYPSIYVYLLEGNPYKPYISQVGDCEDTGELWLLQTTIGKRIGYIDGSILCSEARIVIRDK